MPTAVFSQDGGTSGEAGRNVQHGLRLASTISAMPKKFRFTGVSFRDLLITIGPMTVLVVLLCYLAYRVVDPFPPSSVTMSTGQENSSYAAFGRRYAQILANTASKPSWCRRRVRWKT